MFSESVGYLVRTKCRLVRPWHEWWTPAVAERVPEVTFRYRRVEGVRPVRRCQRLTEGAFWSMIEIVFSLCRLGESGSRAAIEGSVQGRSIAGDKEPNTCRGAIVHTIWCTADAL
jgi:hypothetical protein